MTINKSIETLFHTSLTFVWPISTDLHYHPQTHEDNQLCLIYRLSSEITFISSDDDTQIHAAEAIGKFVSLVNFCWPILFCENGTSGKGSLVGTVQNSVFPFAKAAKSQNWFVFKMLFKCFHPILSYCTVSQVNFGLSLKLQFLVVYSPCSNSNKQYC